MRTFVAAAPSCWAASHSRTTAVRSPATTLSISARPSIRPCPHSPTVCGTGTISPLDASAQTCAPGVLAEQRFGAFGDRVPVARGDVLWLLQNVIVHVELSLPRPSASALPAIT